MQCKKTEAIEKRLTEAGQHNIIRILKQLDNGKQVDLIRRLERLDWRRLEQLRSALASSPSVISSAEVRPASVKSLPLDGIGMIQDKNASSAGKRALIDDRVASLTVAGGQGTRLGHDGPKGTFPITPVKRKSLFQYLAEKIAAARKRYKCRMPWIIMTSPANHGATELFFKSNSFFGLGPETVRFFPQNLNPILSKEGQLAVDDNGRLLEGPDGHGGVFEALHRCGIIEELKSGGFDLISYFQVDNPLVTVADERFLGYHLLENADFSCKVIAKRDPEEGLGVAVTQDGRPRIIEYIDLPEDMASQRTSDGGLSYRFGSIAVHIINTGFSEYMAEKSDTMPWHVAEKKYGITAADGTKKEALCYKLEKFVFDCLPEANGCAFVEVNRKKEFAPVKNAKGQDSPEECRRLLHENWMQTLEQLGVDIAKSEKGDIVVEVSPLLACNPEQE